jgi:glycine dehydrogenase subunit 1
MPITNEERKQMLSSIGVDHIDDLFAPIPKEIFLKENIDLPNAKSEIELKKHFENLALKNKGSNMTSFLGGGNYKHYIPSVVDQMLIRSEFYTAYTPYQPEISQGTLQTIFEFQSMVAELYGMEISNASMYDGATAAAEAVLMASKINKKRKKVVLASTMNPQYIETIKTYTHFIVDEIEIMDFDEKTGKIKESELAKIDENTICVLYQYPNFFGIIEDVDKISTKIKSVKALNIPVITESISLGILKTPGEIDADIAVGEGQSLGMPLHFGGPGAGIFTAKMKYVRKMPGRLVGKTEDKNKNTSFVLTLAAREQHIKREKATSNICSNQGLMITAAAIYLSTMGKQGMKEVALMNLNRAEYLKNKLQKETSVKIAFSGHTFNEFTIELPINADNFIKEMAKKDILAGISVSKYFKNMENKLIVATTEMLSYAEIENFVKATKEITGGAK